MAHGEGGPAGGEPAEDGTRTERGARDEALSYEEARDELASVVKRLEAGGLPLEQSLELWERGERLAAVCAGLLDGARARLSAAMAGRSERPGGNGDPEAPF